MSYILDALRRADSERDRGAVPGVHVRQLPLAGGDGDTPAARLPGWLWPLSAALLLLIGALAWMLLGRDPLREAVASPPVLAAAPAYAPAAAPVAEVSTPT